MGRLTYHVRKGVIVSIPNTAEYLHYVLILCGYKKGRTGLWNQAATDERRPIIGALLNLVPVLEVCQFDKEYLWVNCSGDVIEEIRDHWAFTDYNELPEIFRPFLFLAFDESSETFTVVKMRENIDRYHIGPRKYQG